MIFYFSGTGNSLDTAKRVAEHCGEKLISISAVVNTMSERYEFTLDQDENIGFVYPIYAWAPPKMVLEFIEKLKLHNYKNNYTFSIATCGENIGNTMKVLNACLKKSGMSLDSGFSIKMPNNYIIIGNVDSKDKEGLKLLAAKETLKSITKIIDKKEKGIFKVDKGFLPYMLTSVINPLFNKNAIKTDKFYASDKCTGCGICEKVCNCKSITVKGKPQWGDKCSQCLACIHYCPVHAIQYGKGTERKGRYTNPNVKISDLC